MDFYDHPVIFRICISFKRKKIDEYTQNLKNNSMRIDRIMVLLLRKWLKLIELRSIFVEHILIYSFKFTAFEYFVTKFNGGDGRHLFRL